MNVLVLDPKTVCVEKSEVYQAEQLDKLGMEVIPVELRDAYAFGGGLHCCTADVYREGNLKDYFPIQWSIIKETIKKGEKMSGAAIIIVFVLIVNATS